MMQEKAGQAGKKLSTMTLQTEVRFASTDHQTAFARELAISLKQLTKKYHRPDDEDGQTFRFLVGGHTALANSR